MNIPMSDLLEASITFLLQPGAAVWGDMHWAHVRQPNNDSLAPSAARSFAPFSRNDSIRWLLTGSLSTITATATIIYTGGKSSARMTPLLRDACTLFREVHAWPLPRPRLRTWQKWKRPYPLQPPTDSRLTRVSRPFPLARRQHLVSRSRRRFPSKRAGCFASSVRSSSDCVVGNISTRGRRQMDGRDSVNPFDSVKCGSAPISSRWEPSVSLYSTAAADLGFGG